MLEKDQENQEGNDFEARQNLLGFFSLLLKIDKRINPHLYKKDELKNLLLSGDILDRSGRTPESTTNLTKGSDSVGSSPKAITVFKSVDISRRADVPPSTPPFGSGAESDISAFQR